MQCSSLVACFLILVNISVCCNSSLFQPAFVGLDSIIQVGSKEQEKHVEALNILKLSIFTSKSSSLAYLETQSRILPSWTGVSCSKTVQRVEVFFLWFMRNWMWWVRINHFNSKVVLSKAGDVQQGIKTIMCTAPVLPFINSCCLFLGDLG